MSLPLKAEDLWPLVQKLPHDEQVRLAKLALMAASRELSDSAHSDRTAPPGPDQFSCDDDALAWEAEGWQDLDARR